MEENKQEISTENMEEDVVTVKPVRNYKDRVFRLVFKNKQKLLELYENSREHL